MSSAAYLFAAVLIAADPPVQPGANDLRAMIEEALPSAAELLSVGTPVKADTCRILDRSTGKWVTEYKSGIAVHYRYRRKGVVQSNVLFIVGETIVKALPTGLVRSTDTRLVK